MEDDKFTRKNTQDNFVTEKMDIIKNNLLGQYDEKGNYNIAPQIVNELIELKKVRKSSYNNSMYCSGNLLGYGEILFEICFDNSRDNDQNATSSLFVLEEVDKVNGYLQNIIKTKIAEFKSTVEDFLHDSYTRFNVTDESDEGDDEGKEKKTLEDLTIEDSYILAKKAYMLLLSKLSEEKMLDAYGKYFTMRLSKLTKTDNEFSNAVLSAFNEKYELIQDVFLKEKNYKSLNELLDACIEEVSGTKDIYLTQENEFNMSMTEALAVFTENVNKMSDKAEQKAINMLDASDRQKLNQMNEALENNVPLDSQGTGVGTDDATVLAKDFEASEIQSMGASPVNPSFENPVLFDESTAGGEEKEEDETDEKETEQEQSDNQTTPQQFEQQAQQFAQEQSTMQTGENAETKPNIVEEIARLQAQKQMSEIEKNTSSNAEQNTYDHEDASKSAYMDEFTKFQNDRRESRLETIKKLSGDGLSSERQDVTSEQDIQQNQEQSSAQNPVYRDKTLDALHGLQNDLANASRSQEPRPEAQNTSAENTQTENFGDLFNTLKSMNNELDDIKDSRVSGETSYSHVSDSNVGIFDSGRTSDDSNISQTIEADPFAPQTPVEPVQPQNVTPEPFASAVPQQMGNNDQGSDKFDWNMNEQKSPDIQKPHDNYSTDFDRNM